MISSAHHSVIISYNVRQRNNIYYDFQHPEKDRNSKNNN